MSDSDNEDTTSSGLQKWAEDTFGHEGGSSMLWSISYELIAGGALFVLVGVYYCFTSEFVFWNTILYLGAIAIGLCLIYGGFAMQEKGQVVIPANPPHVGIMTVWGKRMRVMFREGKLLKANFWPLYIDFIVEDVSPTEFEFTVTGIRTAASPDPEADPKKIEEKTGGTMTAKASGALIPNTDSCRTFGRYLDNGGMGDILKRVRGQLEQAFRHIAIKHDWETLSRMKEALAIQLLAQLSKVDFRQIPRDMAPEVVDAMGYEEYEKLPDKIIDPIAYLSPEKHGGSTDDDATKRHKEIEARAFLRIAQENDIPDLMDLGIKFAQLNVPSIEPEGQVGEAADKAAAEQKQREAERREVETNNELANMIVEASKGADGKPTISFPEALEQAMVTKGLIKKTASNIRTGGNNPLLDAAAVVAGGAGKES